MPKARVAYVQRPVDAVQRPGEPVIVLGAPEERQHVVPAPAVAAGVAPAVVIGRRAADVDHRVHRAAAAERAALRHVHPAAGRVRLRLGLVNPGAFRADHPHERRGRVDEERIVGRAGFEQQHAMPGAHEPVRDDAAGRTAADHDVVEFRRAVLVCRRHVSLLAWSNGWTGCHYRLNRPACTPCALLVNSNCVLGNRLASRAE